MAGNIDTGHGVSTAAWMSTVVVAAGVILGGVALIYWNWPAFWAGVGVFLLGCLGAYLGNVMGAVTQYGDPSDGHTPRYYPPAT